MALTNVYRSIFALLILVVAAHPAARASDVCDDLLRNQNAVTNAAALIATPEARAKQEFFETLASVIAKESAAFRELLLEVDSSSGAAYELSQAIKTLNGVKTKELHYLQRTKTLENVAVYGSTNIPLYTLVLHAIIPATVAKNVWFRTPAVTRDLYAKLFSHIKAKMPNSEYLDRIHLLTESKDVQYENFRKRHVLGMNNKGTRLNRNPSEVVIFTGNPETGRAIFEQNSQKLQKITDKNKEPFEQIFLMFGAGMNPVIVTSEARPVLHQVLGEMIEPIKINGGQDCICPNFYAVHESVSKELVDSLIARTSTMKVGRRSDEKADYHSLAFSENLDGLIEYRQKHADYLLTPNAKIDAQSKLVEPHVFVFPMSKFESVELREHYAPFITIFTFKSESELAQMASDPRVRQKAMYTAVFGDVNGAQTNLARKHFRDSEHIVFVNEGVFSAEDGNAPFGGYGPDASSVNLVTRKSDGGFVTRTASRPLLFSKEVSTFFNANSD